ncbi:prefoldin subunit 3 isoform X2 [Procambarus clarkii]|uniref:prefoldin subunit 3 isoform X2 n=1 Tax=Procambarus clarkii TaxID=6728 RepID=UPI001E677503|nr:prefoldin subunit 3-like [Procambarus clarkii]
MAGDCEKPLDESKSYMGIPEAQFVDDVDSYMKKEDNTNAQDVIKRLDEQLNKYKFMDVHLQARRKKLKSQIPDIKSSLQIVKEMKTTKDTAEVIETRFLLSDQVYIKANIPPTDRVCLWLGANVMLEYGLEDAEGLLSKNLGNATKNLTQVEHDLDFLRNQCTTTEVTMARIYNWDVKRRRAEKAAAEDKSKGRGRGGKGKDFGFE